MRFGLVLLLLLLVAAGMLALAARATDPIAVDPLGQVTLVGGGYRLTAPFGVLLTGAAALGLILGLIVAAPGQFSANRRVRQAEKRLGEVESSRSEAAAARAQAATERVTGSGDAAETQRLADEVARRTAATTGQPPPRP
ncbi:MAG TPA: LapA family protein [Rhodothermales bacterium]|nr:LapA family protein [Rhodothermales bacterium]